MKGFVYVLLFVVVLASCKGGKVSDPVEKQKPCVESDTDSTAADSLPLPPKAADGLFDDFIYSYMRVRRFQLERTVFPLPNYVDGQNRPIAKSAWKFDPMYKNLDVYTLIFDSSRSIKAEKDTSLRHVVFEWAYLEKHRVKQYVFDKVDGQWRLTRLESHDMNRNVNSDFYNFYRRFSVDKKFQKSHIKEPFAFKTYDYENFQSIEGLLDVEQWPDYRPKLPSGTITNINYGQSYANSRRRVLMICSQSGGMGCSLTFERYGKDWRLVRLEN